MYARANALFVPHPGLGGSMSALTREHLQQELHLKQRQLDLIMAIDRVRDTMPEPSAMMTALVNVLTEQLQTDLCCICLERNRGTCLKSDS